LFEVISEQGVSTDRLAAGASSDSSMLFAGDRAALIAHQAGPFTFGANYYLKMSNAVSRIHKNWM
jgi:hypothetical protein